jgi:outer membrane receptor for ferrienterochelin and colicin
MRKYLLIIIFAVFFKTVIAQPVQSGNGSVKGFVLDAASGQPVEYVNVVIYSAKDSTMITGVVSDADGKFVIKRLPDGNFYLMFHFMGYSKKAVSGISINTKKHDADVGIVKLEQSALKLNEVEISGYKSNVVYKIDKKVVDMSQAPTEAGASAAEALRNVPGVNVDLDGNVTLRGSSNFIVLIDGKPSAIKGADILKQIPASTIEKIELVTNPSAKYEAEGTSGIINVILKKGTQGFNGLINLSAGTGGKYTGDFLINFKRKKINYFVGGYFKDVKSFRNYYWDSKTIKNSDTSIVNFDVLKKDHQQDYSLRAGFDYNLNPKNTVSLSGEAGDKSWLTDITYPQYKNITSDNINRHTMNGSYMSSPWFYYYLALDFEHKFDTNGQNILITAYYSNSGGKSAYTNYEQLQSNSGQLLNYYFDRSTYRQDAADQEIQAKADYTLPIDTSQKIEAGLLIKFRPKYSSSSAYLYDSSSSSWIRNSAFTNQFDFNHDIFSAYLNYSRSWKKFEFQAGLRGEYSNRQLDLQTTSKKYSYQKFDLFPSLALTRKLGKMGQLQASYSRRINRPDDGSLNPFPEYTSGTILVAGNPELLPEFINSYQLNYMWGPMAVETYYREVNNAMDETFSPDSNGGLFYRPVNIDKKIYYGVDLSGGAPLAKWCLVQLKFSCYNYSMQGSNIASDIPKTATIYEAFLGSRFILTKTTKIEAYGGYSSPNYNSQGKTDQYFYGGASLSQSFLKQMLTLKLSINNPFNIFRFSTSMADQYSNSTVSMTREANVIRFSLSYKLNNYKPIRNEEVKPGNIERGGNF